MTEPIYIVINTRLTDEQLAAVDRIAAARGQTRAAMIRWLLADAIDRFFVPARLTSGPNGESISKTDTAA